MSMQKLNHANKRNVSISLIKFYTNKNQKLIDEIIHALICDIYSESDMNNSQR